MAKLRRSAARPSPVKKSKAAKPAARSKARAGAADYHLTALGRSLLPVLAAMRDWGLSNLPGTEAKLNVQG